VEEAVRSVEEAVRSWIASTASTLVKEKIRIGRLDVDGDGDNDFLVGNELEAKGGTPTLRWRVYFQEDGKFYYSKDEAWLQTGVKHVALGKAPEDESKNALLSGARSGDGDLYIIYAVRFEKIGEKTWKKVRSAKTLVIGPQISESEVARWGSDVSEMFRNYKEYSIEEAKEKFGGVK